MEEIKLSSVIKVGDINFQLRKMLPLPSAALFNRCCRIFAPSVAKIFDSMKAAGNFQSFLQLGTGNLGSTLSEFFQGFKEDEQEKLFRDLFEYVKVQNKRGEWVDLLPFMDTTFMGQPKAMFTLAFKCLSFQYVDFFGDLKSAFRSTNKEVAEQQEIPNQ